MYSHKPEMILKEDSDEMKREILRKDELIKKHYEKLGDWQSLLQDMQASSSSGTSNSGNTSTSANSGSAMVNQAARLSGGPTNVTPGMNIPTPNDGPGGQPAGFVPGNNYRTNIPGSSMQTPLAYLDSMARK